MQSLFSMVLAFNFMAPPTIEIPLEFQGSPAAEKTYQEYWNETGLKLDLTYRTLSASNCYQTAKKFTACYEAINMLVAASNPSSDAIKKEKKPYRITTLKSMLSRATVAYTIVKEVGPIVIVAVDPSVKPVKSEKPQQTLLEYRAAEKKAQADLNKELESLFTLSASSKVDFVSIGKWVESEYISKDRKIEAFASALALNGYLKIEKDPHTSLEPAAMWAGMTTPGANTKKYFGIGCPLKVVNNKIYFGSPFRGSPALAAGLRANDNLIAINDVAVSAEEELANTIAKIKGDENTIVKLKIVREGKTLEIAITRGPIVSGQNVESYMVEDAGKKIAYIRLNDFMELNACSEINEAAASLTAQGAKGLILDLRNNGGGRLDSANCISSIFVGAGKTIVVQKSLLPGAIEDATSVSKMNHTLRTEDPETGKTLVSVVDIKLSTLPMVTLINGHSASASEIVSGALQNFGRSLVLGDRSYGKATVQMPADYGKFVAQAAKYDPFNSQELGLTRDIFQLTHTDVYSKVYYKFTIQRFYMESGFTNQIVGIMPDVLAYSAPKATDSDLAIDREEDEYTSLPPAGVPNTKVFPHLDRVKSCMAKSGLADKLFNSRQKDAILPDYQLLSAQSALKCM